VLPGATYTEKPGIYVNTEGRVQWADRANFPPGEAREDWAIFRALSDVLGQRLPFDSFLALRKNLFATHPHFAARDEIAPGSVLETAGLNSEGSSPAQAPFISPVQNFYATNPIARASGVMAECGAIAQRHKQLAAAE
jgi:NADH-quinone oxidoreductase subunit G